MEAPAMPEEERTLTVLVIGDYPVVRAGVVTALRANRLFAEVTEVEAGPRAVELCGQLRPDGVVLDLESRHHGEAWRLLGDLRRGRRKLRVVVLSEREDGATVRRALRAGARAYVSKRDVLTALPRAVDWLCQTSEHFLGDCVQAGVVGDAVGGRMQLGATDLAGLSERQREVFQLVGERNGPAAIARRLGISVKTVETHQDGIKVKLGLAGAAELQRRAVAWAAKGGMVTGDTKCRK